jgi:hypothetical protein
MKKISALLLIFIYTISFGQRNEYKQALVLSDKKSYHEANLLLIKLLNNEFGIIDKETRYFILATISDNYHGLEDFQNSYDYYIFTIDFAKKNQIHEELIDDMQGLAESTRISLEFMKAVDLLKNKNYYISNLLFEKLRNNEFGLLENENYFRVLVNMGENFNSLKNYKSSFEFYNNAIEFAKKNHVLEDLVPEILKKAQIVKLNIIN